MTKSRWIVWTLGLPACTGTLSQGDEADPGGGIMTLGSADGTSGAAESGPANPDTPANNTTGDGAPDDGSDSSAGTMPPRFDVGQASDSFCATHAPGIHCVDATAITCDANSDVVDETLCTPGFCVPGEGCVVCLAGQYSCLGDRVRQCDDAASPPAWQEIATCDPSSNEVCDASTGTCVQTAPIGFPCTSDSECGDGQHCAQAPHQCVTGRYYKFSSFPRGEGGLANYGYDVDGWDNRLYVSSGSSNIDVYEVNLLDSDGDGQLEPDQHPDNPDSPGPIEERVLTLVDTCGPSSTTCPLPLAGLSMGSAELYVNATDLYVGGQQVTQYSLTGTPSLEAASRPQFNGRLSHLGYDDVSGIWYGSYESNRRVYQYNASTGTWGIAFDYPALAGSHMDGMEVVVQPGTNIAYVYVSDMTSDFIGQYHIDPEQGWVQDNLFEYQDDTDVSVEGMGFGAFNHFWATGGPELYEIGGGDITEFVEPPPPPE